MNMSTLPVKKILFGLLGLLFLIGIALETRLPRSIDPRGTAFPTHAFAGGSVWSLEIANTDALRSLGLGERDRLTQGTGMLFLFDTPRAYGFWMKGMRFPLDMIFLSQGKIVFIERGIQPDDPKIVMPPTPVDQVLELNAGEAAGLSVGDRIWYWRSF